MEEDIEPNSKYLKKDKPAPEPKISEFQIKDQVSEISSIILQEDEEDEVEDTIRSSIYESIEKSTRLKEMAEIKFGQKDRQKPTDTESDFQTVKEETESKAITHKDSEISTKKSIGKRPPKGYLKSESRSHYIKDVNKSEIVTEKEKKNFQEFRIDDADSKIGYEGFSESNYWLW